MQRLPQISISVVAKNLGVAPQTVRSALGHLQKLGIVQEITGKKRDQVFVYKNYLDLLVQDTQPL